MQTRLHQISRYRIALKALLAGVVLSCLFQSANATDRRQEILDEHDGCVVSELDVESLGLESLPIVPLNDLYDRFDVLVDSVYYANNEAELNAFFVDFEPRFALLESTTGWNSESLHGTKFKILVLEAPGACYGGSATRGEALFAFSDPLFKSMCLIPGGTGELGDTWPYMGVAIHEATHAISPKWIFNRAWLREGWAIYLEYNLLSNYGDISQATADLKILSGTSSHNWAGYVNNDYHDTSPDNNEIQESKGYEITAWMFSMLRDNHSLIWTNFYDLLGNNIETLDKTFSLVGFGLTRYSLDMVMIDLFGRSLDMNFSEIKDVFEYDVPGGPGWGVRNWTDEDRSWYADLTVNISLSDTLPNPADTIDVYATVHNTGDVSLDSVDVLITIDTNLAYEVFVDIPANDSVVVSTQFAIPGELNVISANVDRNDRKIELDDSNNADTLFASLGCCSFPGDANSSGGVNIADVTFLIARIFAGGQAPVCGDEADANGSDTVNIADVTYLIARIFASGSAPVCGNTGI